ncbi:hypothetical protein [Legionella shakespearei]|uniref:Uncharacterized protein n=1 Tax=Legionella shakespearei DSM 23087 TaxID=1122169 RepID=A0A0W0ZAR9_9GAMM|nr:hypothetical protein [Legionella shakespearei]KTD66231.1 hypothetical protein Lsha_0125 [Legionella shakespearei DSM 23087]
MSLYFKALIEKLRDNSPKSSTAHHLYLLGTAVDYVDKPTTDKSYIRGETFSYAAQLMTHVLGEQESVIKYEDAADNKSPHYAHPYHSNSVDVINGADTPGFEVGDRLAKALMLALGAVAEGKTNLSISGFSRGGVESIVLTHELERILKALEEDAKKEKDSEKRTLARIIQDSNSVPGLAVFNDPSYTRSALKGLVTAEKLGDEEALKARLLMNLKALQVNLFVLDPVPGGNFGKVIRLGWQEPSFYTLPDFVKKKFEFVQKHETSNAFKPIIPLDMPYEVIPGCHGTGDGNQFDDNGDPVPETFANRDLSGVQDLVLRRWLDFTFTGQVHPEQPVDLGHSQLDAVTNAYLPASEEQRNHQLLQNYTKIQENYPAFEWLSTRNYKGLGQYMALRQTHFHQRGNTPITDLDIHGDGKTFLNLQHVKLWMSNKLESVNFFDMKLVGQISWLKENIKTAFTPVDLSQSSMDQTHMVSRLLQDKNNHLLAKESLSYLVSTITQTYLRNHLSQAEREECRACVASAFETLDDVEQKRVIIDKERTEFASSFSKEMRKDITTVVVQHQNALVSQARKLLEDGEAIANNTVSSSSEERAALERDALAWLINTQKLTADLDRLAKQISGLEEWCVKPMLIHSWTTIIPGLELNSEESFEETKGKFLRIVHQQQELLLHRSSDVLKKIPGALDQKPEELDTDFYQYIYQFAGMEKREHSLQSANMELAAALKQAEKQLDERTQERDNGLHALTEERKIKAELSEKVTRLTKELATAKEHLMSALESVEQSDRNNSQIEEALVQFKELVGQLKVELDKIKEETAQERRLHQAAKDKIELLKSQVEEKQLLIEELQIQVYTLQDTSESQVRSLDFYKDAAKRTEQEIEALQRALESLKSEASASAKQAEKALAEAQFKIELLLQKNEELEKEIVEGTGQNNSLIQALESEKRKAKVNAENAAILQTSDQSEIQSLRKALESKKKEAADSADNAARVHADDQAQIERLNKALEAQRKEATAGVDEAARVHADDQAEIARLNKVLESQRRETAAVVDRVASELSEAESKIKKVEADLVSQQRIVNAYKSDKERAAIVTVARLLERTTHYMTHLNSANSESALLDEKKQAVQALLGHLQNTEVLPSKQLELFNDSLQQSQDTLKEHRDPAWQRFFRDCLRIIALALSGVGFYRMLHGESPRFFKPSEGENFVDEVTETTAPTNLNA